MLVASRPIGLLDRYRVPYEVGGPRSDRLIRIGRADGRGPELIARSATPSDTPQPYLLNQVVLFSRLGDRFEVADGLAAKEWRSETPIYDLSGVQCASIDRATDGSIFVPFDLDGVFEVLLDESYLPYDGSTHLSDLARAAYYRARPVLPYRVRMGLRRGFRRFQERAQFPSWPTETSFHALEAVLLALIEGVAGEPLPWLSPWPDQHEWALVLTHDVEGRTGYQNVRAVQAIEKRFELRSAWYFVPESDYVVEGSVLDELRAHGCEICLHGLRHDGRDMSPKTFKERLPAMRQYAEAWGARGFRGPSTLRSRELISQLELDHDSSWSDVARYEPQPGGTCSWLPFFIGDLVELPITLPQDHTVFELSRELTATSWTEKTNFLKANGGMALLLTHPDYLVDPSRLSVYERFIAEQVRDSSAWHALPREVAEWWRLRAETRIEWSHGSWVARGPAASTARIRLGHP